jgi:hypothetical protein
VLFITHNLTIIFSIKICDQIVIFLVYALIWKVNDIKYYSIYERGCLKRFAVPFSNKLYLNLVIVNKIIYNN